MVRWRKVGIRLETFESYRNYLFSIAYRMLGSAMDAEDMVQETYLRYQTTPAETIQSHKAFLTTIITRLCMDELQLARRKRELYLGPWLPEPIRTEETSESINPEKHVELQESISFAFMVLMEQLQPFERAVFLLREVFGYEFIEIATMLEKSEAACRRSFSRAKHHLRAHRPRFPASPQTHRQLLSAYLQAAQTGDLTRLTNLLSENVTLWADGGGKTLNAFRHPVRGRDGVAQITLGFSRFQPASFGVELAEVNGQTAAIIRVNGKVFAFLSIDVDQAQIQTIRIIRNPEKLARL